VITRLIPLISIKTPEINFFPSTFIAFRFLKLHPLSNIPLPEGRAVTAWETSKPKKKVFLTPLNIMPLTSSHHSSLLFSSLLFSSLPVGSYNELNNVRL
jgi:hypothetical protein